MCYGYGTKLFPTDVGLLISHILTQMLDKNAFGLEYVNKAFTYLEPKMHIIQSKINQS